MVRDDDRSSPSPGTSSTRLYEHRRRALLLDPGAGVRSDIARILCAQALRALAYGFGSVLVGASLEAKGWSTTRVGLLLSFVLAGPVPAAMGVTTAINFQPRGAGGRRSTGTSR